MLKVKQLTKSYITDRGRVEAVRGVDFEVGEGELFTLLGPSGCGKTTTLRCVAGLETPDSGEIRIGEKAIFADQGRTVVPTYLRGIGMVFQSYAIWPHMTVFQNVAFPLIRGSLRVTKSEVNKRVSKALSLVQMETMLDRPAPLLSGGQQQRVALARALVHEPKVLLLDEPLSNLDAKLRADMRLELKELMKRINITTLYVTHDQVEALSLSDRIAIMDQGRIVQIGSPRDIYLSPKNTFAASFVGQSNLFKARVTSRDNGGDRGTVETGIGPLICYLPRQHQEGDVLLVAIRPEAILADLRRPERNENVFEAEVESVTFIGDALECEFRIGDGLVRVKADPVLELREGIRAYLYLPPSRCLVLSEPVPPDQERD